MYRFTRSHDKPGSQVNRQATSSSTIEVLTLMASILEPLSPLARMYKVRATSEAADTMAEAFMFAAFYLNIHH